MSLPAEDGLDQPSLHLAQQRGLVKVEVVAGVEAQIEARATPRSGRAAVLFAKPLSEPPKVTLELGGEPQLLRPACNAALTECRLTGLPLGKVTVTIADQPVTLDVREGQVARARLR